MEQSMTYVLFHSRFQLSSPQRLSMAAIIEKKKARRGRWEERKGWGGGGGAEASLPLFLLPIVPHALFFFFLLPILSPSHIKGISIFTTREAKHCER